MEKTCGKCGVTKPVEMFARRKSGYQSKCKECHNQYYRDYWKNSEAYEKHKKRVRERKPHRALRYGLTIEEYESLVDKYDGKCWICRERRATHIDHSHSSGEVRGVLCAQCNSGIGYLGDTYDSVKRALDYLS